MKYGQQNNINQPRHRVIINNPVIIKHSSSYLWHRW